MPLAVGGVVAIVVVVLIVLFLMGRFAGTAAPAETPVPTVAASSPTPVPAEVGVPINLKGAKDLGAIHIELVYDSAVLEAVKFEAGELSENALIEANLELTGRVIIGIVDTEGIGGDGAVAVLFFRVLGSQGDSVLTLENFAAHNATSLVDVPAITTDGSFKAGDQSFTAPEIVFGGGR